jgi:hypothetical protein
MGWAGHGKMMAVFKISVGESEGKTDVSNVYD